MSSKVISSKSMAPVRGGGGSMIGKQSAGPVKSGTSAGHANGGGKFAKAGGKKMVGKQSSKPSKKC